MKTLTQLWEERDVNSELKVRHKTWPEGEIGWIMGRGPHNYFWGINQEGFAFSAGRQDDTAEPCWELVQIARGCNCRETINGPVVCLKCREVTGDAEMDRNVLV